MKKLATEIHIHMTWKYNDALGIACDVNVFDILGHVKKENLPELFTMIFSGRKTPTSLKTL